MKKITESDIKKNCIDFFRKKNILYARINPTRLTGKKIFCRLPSDQLGIGDFITLYKNRYIEIEVKTTIGKQSQYQLQRQDLVRRHGGEYYVIRSLDDLLNIYT